MAIGKPIVDLLQRFEIFPNENDKIKQLTNLIDQQIYQNYKLWPGNYIAMDLLEDTQTYTSFYNPKEKEDFLNHVHAKIAKLQGDTETLMNLFLRMYSNRVKSKTWKSSEINYVSS